MKLKLTLGALSLGAILALSGCGSSSKSDGASSSTSSSSSSTSSGGTPAATGRAAINASAAAEANIKAVAENVIKAGYAKLGDGAVALNTLLGAFTSNVDAAQVTAARAAWKIPRAYWEASEAYIVTTSPSVGNSADGNTDSWPVHSAADIAAGLALWDGDTLTIQNADGEIKGFHTIEYYLFGDGAAVETAADAATRLNAMTNAQGKYLAALGNAFEHDMLNLTTQWTVEDDAATTDEDETGILIAVFTGKNRADAAGDLLQGTIDIAGEVGDGKIADPMNGGSPDTTKVESQFSWNSTADFYNNIHSVEKVWNGGLKNLATVAKVPAAKITAVDTTLVDSLTKLAAISGLDVAAAKDGTAVIAQADAFRNKLTSDYASIEAAQAAVQALTAALEDIQADNNWK